MSREIKYWSQMVFLGLCLLVVDGIGIGYLNSRFPNLDDKIVFSSLVIYNIFAFAIQPIIGLIVDFKGKQKYYIMVGLIISSFVILFDFPIWIFASILGLSNCIVHIGGAALVFEKTREHIAPLGVFVGIGSIGAGVGSLFVLSRYILSSIGLLMAFILIVTIIMKDKNKQEDKVQLKYHIRYLNHELFLVAIIFIMVAIFLRGYTNYITPALFPKSLFESVLIIVSICLGKVLGGFIADNLEIEKTIIIFYLPALVILSFFRDTSYLYFIGLFFFNITMPLTLYLIIKCISNFKTFAYGLHAGIFMVGTFVGQIIPLSLEYIFIISSLLISFVLLFSSNRLLGTEVEYIDL